MPPAKPKKAAAKPLPPHLEAFLKVLEKQDPRETPNRLACLDAAEKAAGEPVVLEDAMQNKDFSTRYRRWEERLMIALGDAQIGRALSGKASPTPIIAAMGGFRGGQSASPSLGRDGNGRPVLERHHRSRKSSFEKW